MVEQRDCPICYTDITTGVMTTKTLCGHEFCFNCLQKNVNTNMENAFLCPVCRTEMGDFDTDPMEDDSSDDDDEAGGYGLGSLYYQDGSKYTGTFDFNSQPNGYGESYTPGGIVYKGYWVNGEKEGNGSMTWTSGDFMGDCYTGGFHKDERSGQGTLQFSDGDKYVGQWKFGDRHGFGTQTYEHDADSLEKSYTGQWSGDDWYGTGTIHYKSGEIFEGTFCNGEIHGEGKFTTTGGYSYIGYWDLGRRIRRDRISLQH